MHALHEHVGGHQHLFVAIVEDSAVIAHPIKGAGVHGFEVLSEPVDQAEFAKGTYFGHGDCFGGKYMG